MAIPGTRLPPEGVGFRADLDLDTEDESEDTREGEGAVDLLPAAPLPCACSAPRSGFDEADSNSKAADSSGSCFTLTGDSSC